MHIFANIFGSKIFGGVFESRPGIESLASSCFWLFVVCFIIAPDAVRPSSPFTLHLSLFHHYHDNDITSYYIFVVIGGGDSDSDR